MMVGLKSGLAIGGALVAWILGLYGYLPIETSLQGQQIVQPETVAQGTKMLVSIFPSIPFLMAVGLLFFYDINKNKEIQIEQDLYKQRNSTN